jgi:hypothetical protein
MSYNLPAREDTVPFRLGGYAPCLGPHRGSAPSFLRTFCGKPALSSDAKPFRISPSSDTNLLCCSIGSRTYPMRRPADTWAFRGVRFGVGASVGRLGTSPWRMPQDGGANRFFPPLEHALVKAVACELVAETQQPLSRQSLADVTAWAHKAWANRSEPVKKLTTKSTAGPRVLSTPKYPGFLLALHPMSIFTTLLLRHRVPDLGTGTPPGRSDGEPI